MSGPDHKAGQPIRADQCDKCCHECCSFMAKRQDLRHKAERRFCDVARRVLSAETFTRIMEIAKLEVEDDG